MKNIPDFSIQVLEIERQIKARADVAAEDWKDEVQQNYYNKYIYRYEEAMELYIHGGTGMAGMGINDLLPFVSDKLEQMAQLTGVSENVAFACAAGMSHDGSLSDNNDNKIDVEGSNYRNEVVNNLERVYWNEQWDGPRPGEHDNEDVVKIMDNRKSH